MSLKDAGKWLGGLLLAALLMWWVLRGTDAATLWSHVRRASVRGMLLCALLNLAHNYFRILRWRALLAPIRPRVPLRPMFTAVILGYMTSWVVPGRLGELVRPILLSGRVGVPLGPCIGSVVADRLLDVISVVTLFAFAAWITPLEGEAAHYELVVRGSAVLLVVAVLIMLVLMLIASARSKDLAAWFERRPATVRWIGRTALSLSHGVRALRSPRLLLPIVVHSLLAWTTIAAATWFGVRAAGAEISLGAVMIIMPMLMIGVAVPTPGGAGSYHGAMKVGLMLFGVSEVAAISAGLLIHALVTVPLIVLGLLLLWTEGVSWRHVVHAAQQLRDLGQEHEPPGAQRAAEGVS